MERARGADTRRPPVGVIAIGTSAGGLAALERLATGLPASLPVPVLVVQHVDPRHRSMLPDILARHTDLVVVAAAEGRTPRPGTVTFAVPDHHLVVGPGGVCHLTRTEPVRFVRPSIDVLFESVARVYGARSVVVVLTGSGSDGAVGAEAVRRAGGTVVVQDPETAEFPSMPRAALGAGTGDLVLALEDIPGALVELTAQPEAR